MIQDSYEVTIEEVAEALPSPLDAQAYVHGLLNTREMDMQEFKDSVAPLSDADRAELALL